MRVCVFLLIFFCATLILLVWQIRLNMYPMIFQSFPLDNSTLTPSRRLSLFFPFHPRTGSASCTSCRSLASCLPASFRREWGVLFSRPIPPSSFPIYRLTPVALVLYSFQNRSFHHIITRIRLFPCHFLLALFPHISSVSAFF